MAKWNSPSFSTSRGRSGSMCTRAPKARVPWVRLFVARTSASSFTSTRFGRDAVGAGVVVHLLQVGPVAEPPRLRQRRPAVRRQVAPELVLVQEPRQLRPTVQALLQLDAVGVRCAYQPDQIPRVRLLTNRLRAEKHRADRLLQLAAFQSGLFVLDGARLRQLALQDRGPVVPAALGHLARGDAGQLAGRLGDAPPGPAPEGTRWDRPGATCPRVRRPATRWRTSAGCRASAGTGRAASSGCRRGRSDRGGRDTRGRSAPRRSCDLCARRRRLWRGCGRRSSRAAGRRPNPRSTRA